MGGRPWGGLMGGRGEAQVVLRLGIPWLCQALFHLGFGIDFGRKFAFRMPGVPGTSLAQWNASLFLFPDIHDGQGSLGQDFGHRKYNGELIWSYLFLRPR